MTSPDSAADRFERVSRRFTDRVSEVPAAAWNNPAPCAGWTAVDVVRHLVEWVPSVFDRAGLTFTDPSVDDDPAGAWQALASTLSAALDDPDVASRTFDAGPPGEMTVESAIDMLVTGDVHIHTWDLARAVGLDETLDNELNERMYAGMLPMGDMLRASRHFGPEVEVAADADVQTKLLAFTGRRP